MAERIGEKEMRLLGKYDPALAEADLPGLLRAAVRQRVLAGAAAGTILPAGDIAEVASVLSVGTDGTAAVLSEGTQYAVTPDGNLQLLQAQTGRTLIVTYRA